MEENRILSEVKAVTDSVLQLDGGASRFQRQTPLLGAIPEFDSMAVVALITALEEHFGISVHDEEISAETFETVGALADFVALKLRDGPT